MIDRAGTAWPATGREGEVHTVATVTATATATARTTTAAGTTTAASPASPAAAAGRAGAGRAFLAWGVGGYVLVLAVVLVLSLRETGGHLGYVLDDPAIHLSLATNLVEHGTWGVEPGHFESASSSPLWTVVLAAYLAVVPGGDTLAPLVLNVAAALAVIALLGANQEALRPSRHRPVHAAAVVALVTVPLFLPGLTLVGMEHTLHMALVLGAVSAFHRHSLGAAGNPGRSHGTTDDDRSDRSGGTGGTGDAHGTSATGWAGGMGAGPAWPPYLLLALATATRPETAFVALGIGVALLARSVPGWVPPGSAAAPWRRQARRVALVGVAAGLPLIAIAGATRLGGQGWLPNSVAAKSVVEDAVVPLHRASVDRLTADPLVGLLTVLAVAALAVTWRQPRRLTFPAIVLVVTVAGHMVLARIGWYERYQSYLVVLGAYVGLQALADLAAGGPHGGLPRVEGGRPVARRASRPALLVLAALLACGTKVFLTVDAPLAVADTYEQRYQAGRFLARYYDGRPVATGELGYISLLHDGPVTDLLGLGDHEVLRERRATGGRPPAAYWDRLADERGFEVVAVYPATLGEETPDDWLLAGSWTLPRRTVSAYQPRFEFWATGPEALLTLQENLRHFAADLPGGVVLTINPAATTEAEALLVLP